MQQEARRRKREETQAKRRLNRFCTASTGLRKKAQNNYFGDLTNKRKLV
jgi:hypothetical protein